MAIEAKARIVVEGGSEALKELQGVQRATRAAGERSKRTGSEQERAAAKAAKAYEQQAREAEKAAKQAGTAQEREAKKAAAAIARIEAKKARDFEREARRQTRIAEREGAKQVRDAEKTAKAKEKANRDALRSAGRFVAGATGAVVAGGIAAAAVARGVVGQDSAAERVKRGNVFRQSLIISAGQANLTSSRRDEIQGALLQTSDKTGIEPVELAAGLESAQKQFNAFEDFAGIMDDIAVTAKSSGTPVQELVRAMGFMRQAFGLTKDETVEAMNLMVAAASKGSIEVSDFAASFAPVAGIFAEETRQKGVGGVRQFLGTAQGIGTLGAGADISATMMERFVSALNDDATRKKLKRIGIDTLKSSPQEVIEKLATSPKFTTASQRQKIFTEVRASKAVTALVSAQQRVAADRAAGVDSGAVDLASIAGVDAQSGADLTQKLFEELSKSGTLETEREVIKMQTETIRHLGDYNDQILLVLRASNKLETAFGSLSLWASSIATVGVSAAMLKFVTSFGGGGGPVGADGLPVNVPIGGALKGGAAIAGGIATALPVGVATFAAASALGADSFGARIGSRAFDIFGGGQPNRPFSLPVDTEGVTGKPVDAGKQVLLNAQQTQTQRDQLAEARRTNKALDALTEQVRMNGTGPLVNVPGRAGMAR